MDKKVRAMLGRGPICGLLSLILFIGLMFLTPELNAQEQIIFKGNKYKIGFMVGYGAQNLDQAIHQLSESNQARILAWAAEKGIDPADVGLDVPYNYQVYYYQFQYYYTISSNRTTSTELLFQPQYNVTRYQPVMGHSGELGDVVKGYEFGINISLVFRKNILSDYVSLYMGFGAGPHWVSGTPIVQADGFIFSLTGFAGVNLKLVKDLYLDFRPGISHISNAGIKHPNKGLNDLVISAGFFITY